jgi:hypothetical protein
MLWLTVVVALVVSWYVDRSRLVSAAAREYQILRRWRALGFDVEAIVRHGEAKKANKKP